MMIQHHVADDLLLAYAAGDLDESWSLVVATHLALCTECRVAVRHAEEAGGVLMEELEPAAVAPGALTAIMDLIDAGPADAVLEKQHVRSEHAVSQSACAGSEFVIPEPLRTYTNGDLDSLKWRSLGRGAYHIPLSAGEGMVRLLRIPAGKPVPDHSHNGRELTLVLKGNFRDDRGTFARGDVEDCDDTVQHQPIAGPEEDCICLAVTEAPLRFKSLAARIVQPFIGI